jgi:hypothetical protein
MQFKAFDRTERNAEQASPLKRRGLILGAGVAGAAAIAVKTLPVATVEVASAAASAGTTAAQAGGYQLTQHVLRYYQTTRI